MSTVRTLSNSHGYTEYAIVKYPQLRIWFDVDHSLLELKRLMKEAVGLKRVPDGQRSPVCERQNARGTRQVMR